MRKNNLEQAIEKLCEKFGVTANYLVDELCRYYTTMDKIGLAFWIIALILAIIILVIGSKKEWLNLDTWRGIILIIVIGVILVLGIIITPYMVVDLVSWHVSPISKTIELLTR